MKVVFDAAASGDLDRIYAWIAQDNPRAASTIIERIETRVMRLAIPGLEHMGRKGKIEGTRELSEAPYIIVYRANEERQEVIILAVLHAARDR
ncbi:MAG TPA: type II toxin-antitoxin system RelE/ParE family toxin [Stellaceae bacterium]|jgi:addiction module RelE/StbE family toxin|nr:type II toxin-antitoxin system RelE/ParE family toxin [Stellaceae bacterium]